VVLHLNEHNSGIKRTFERSLPGKLQLFAQLLPISSNHMTGAVVVKGLVVTPVVDIGFVVVPMVVMAFVVVTEFGLVVGLVVVEGIGVVVGFVVVVGFGVVDALHLYKSMISLASISVMSLFLRMT
jgi:hypothetical protein